jgi:energy-coupling factor transporter ATP-binding protein EcfA2
LCSREVTNVIASENILSFFLDTIGRTPQDWASSYYWTTDSFRAWIYSDQAAAAAEMAEYLRPLPYTSTAGPLSRIALVHDAARFGLMAAIVGGETIYAKPDVCYRRIALNGLELFIHERPLSPAHVILRSGNDLVVVNRSVSEEAFRTPVRILRELALREMQKAGGLFMHAAAVVSRTGRAALILGDKGAGKSTLMWALVGLGPLLYIANDRCIVRNRGDTLKIYGWPLSIRLGRGLVESPAAMFPSATFRRKENMELGSIETAPRIWGERAKVELTPREFEVSTDKRMAAEGEVCVLLMPRFTEALVDARVADIGNDEATAKFRNSITEPADCDYLRGWLQTRPQSDHEVQTMITQAAAAAGNIPAFSIEGSADHVLSRPDILDGILRELE